MAEDQPLREPARNPEQCRKDQVGNRIAYGCTYGKAQDAGQHPLEPEAPLCPCAFNSHSCHSFSLLIAPDNFTIRTLPTYSFVEGASVVFDTCSGL